MDVAAEEGLLPRGEVDEPGPVVLGRVEVTVVVVELPLELLRLSDGPSVYPVVEEGRDGLQDVPHGVSDAL